MTASVRDVLNPVDLSRRVYVSLGNMFGLSALLFFGIRDLIIGRYVLAAIELSAGSLYVVNILLLRFYRRSLPVFRFGLVQGVLLFLFLAAFRSSAVLPAHQEFFSASLFWSYIIPLVSFFLTGRKEGFWWTFGYFVAVGLLLYLGPKEYFVQYTDEVKLEFLVSFFIISALTFMLESLRYSLSGRLEERNRELAEAVEKVKTLSGLVPICSSCKKIRDDRGYWESLEEYLQTHTDVQFSHGLCEECMQSGYPEIYEKKHDNDPR